MFNNIKEINSNLQLIGKRLWTGSFTSGTITVPGLSKYTKFIVNVAGVICIGNSNYGIGGWVEYGGYSIHMHGYRFTSDRSKETLTIDSINLGGSDGSKNVAIIDIYGLF